MSQAPSVVQELQPGSIIGAYRVESLLGRGGMSAVYRAEHVSLQRKAALKVLNPALAERVGFRERFGRESRLVAQLDHPNIIPVYDAGEADGLLYIAMRLVAGVGLDDFVEERGPLDPELAISIVARVADALDAAHAHDLVHRDVKPGNILIEDVDEVGRVFLTDFGIAWQPFTPESTRPDEFVGSVDWAAPEQIEGRPVTQRTDVYALGAVLFYALTARRPFEADTDVAVMYAHLLSPPPGPADVVPTVPALDAVVRRALAKQPGDRFASAGELARAAQGATGTPPAAPTAAPTAARERTATELARPPVAHMRLKSAFRYVHEPLDAEHGAIPFLGDRAAIDALKNRIRHSTGGAFLVTGFRGVGKTTVIRRALRELREERPDGHDLIHVSLNVARPMSTEALLFEVVRRLFEELTDRGVLASLPDEVQRAVILAYTRTSLSFKETRSSSRERTRSLGMSLESIPVVGRLGPTLDFSRKQTSSLASEAAFLAYSDADVEHDFLRIVALLRHDEEPATGAGVSWWRRRLLPVSRRLSANLAWRGRLVVVVDELDKLTANREGKKALERILMDLKNLLTTRGIHFIFVAGPELHDMALRESQRGSGVYESVFAWQLYVPCVWRAADELLAKVVDATDPQEEWLGDRDRYELFRDYLEFKTRGIPRLLLLELNSFVRWPDGRAAIAVDGIGARRVALYARLQRALADFVESDEHVAAPFAIPIDEDRWRLGAYYVVDWILRCRDRAFTVDELVGSAQETPFDPNLVLAPSKVRELIEHLVAREILVQVQGRPDQTYVADTPEANVPAYRVVDSVFEDLGVLRRASERERADLVSANGAAGSGSDGGAHPWADTGALGIAGAGRYELRRELGRSSMGSVYRAFARELGREVAVKLLDVPELLADETARNRFRRAAETASSLSHPNLVPTLETFEDEDGRLGIVMELVEGTPLSQVLSWGAVPPARAVTIALAVLDALDYLHLKGLARFDLKPSSILLAEAGTPLLSDVALARAVGGARQQRTALTRAGVVVGTPMYMAPEQVKGEMPDIRADLYATGLVLYEMLAGEPARPREEAAMALLYRIVTEEVAVDGLPVSSELRGVVGRALALSPADRYPEPSSMRAALLATPEAASLTEPAAAAT